MSLSAVIRPPAMSVDDLKEYIWACFHGFDPSRDHGYRDLDGAKLFGQSQALHKGFAMHGLMLESLDVRYLGFPARAF